MTLKYVFHKATIAGFALVMLLVNFGWLRAAVPEVIVHTGLIVHTDLLGAIRLHHILILHLHTVAHIAAIHRRSTTPLTKLENV